MNVVSLLTATLVLATAFSAFGQTPAASTPYTFVSAFSRGRGKQPTDLRGRSWRAGRAANGATGDYSARPEVHLPAVQCGQSEAVCGIHQQRLCLHRGRSVAGAALSRETAVAREVADRDADTKQAEVEVTKTSIADAVKADYLQLAYLQQTLGILRQNEVRFLTSSSRMRRPIIRSARECSRMSSRRR